MRLLVLLGASTALLCASAALGFGLHGRPVSAVIVGGAAAAVALGTAAAWAEGARS